MMTTPASKLTALARTLRATYVRERSAFEALRLGQAYRYRVPRKYDGAPAIETDDGVVLEPATTSVWRVLAAFLAGKDVDPVLFVEAQFDGKGPTDRPPEPRQLKSAAALERAREYRAAAAKQIPLQLKLESERASTRIAFLQRYGREAKEDSYAIVLLDTDLELSPLFRYCLALSIGGLRFRRIARRFEVEACVQYQRYRAYYKRSWGDLLPAGFDRHARTIYGFILSEDDGHGKEDGSA